METRNGDDEQKSCHQDNENLTPETNANNDEPLIVSPPTIVRTHVSTPPHRQNLIGRQVRNGLDIVPSAENPYARELHKKKKKRKNRFLYSRRKKSRKGKRIIKDAPHQQFHPVVDSPKITDDNINEFYNDVDINVLLLEEHLERESKETLEIIDNLYDSYCVSTYGQHNKESNKYVLLHMNDLVQTLSSNVVCAKCGSKLSETNFQATSFGLASYFKYTCPNKSCGHKFSVRPRTTVHAESSQHCIRIPDLELNIRAVLAAQQL